MNKKKFTKHIMFLLLFILINCCAFSQTYHVIVILDDNRNITGELLNITPDSVTVIDEKTDSIIVLEVSDISTLYLKELNKSIKFPIADISNIFNADDHAKSDFSYKYRNRFEFGLGLVEGSKYKEFMEQAYSNISGGGFWVDMEIGYAIHLLESIYLTPRFVVLWSSIKTVTEGFEYAPNRKANVILLPGVSGTYFFGMDYPSFFASVYISPIFPFSDVERFDFKSGGVAFGAAVGYILMDRYELELGYQSVPVQAQNGTQPVEDTNFGGFSLIVRFRF